MALPFSCDYPIVPIVLYDPQMPPAVPSIDVIQQVRHIVPMVAAAVANEAGSKANNNAARMFCYNLLVNNYWRNEYFTEVVKLTCDLIAYNYSKNLFRTVESGIQDCVFQILTYYSGNLVFLFEDLKSECSQQVIDAAYQNVPNFNNLKQEIIKMYNNQPGYHNPGFGNPSSNMMGGNAHTPMMQPNQGMPINTVVNTPNGPMIMTMQGLMPYQQQPMYPQQQMQQPMMQPPMQQQYYSPQQQQPQHNTFGSSNTFGNVNTERSVTTGYIQEDRFSSRIAPVQETKPVQQVVRDVNTEQTKQKFLIIDGGSEMDRSKHQITFFGDSYSTDSVIRGKRFAESTTELIKTNDIFDTSKENQYVHPTWLLEPFVDTALFVGKAQQFEHQKNNTAVNVFRCFSIVANPVLSTSNIKPYMAKLQVANSFIELGVKLKAIASSLSINDENKQYTDSVISFLNQIEITLTSIVNDFLTNKIRSSITITSFTEDIGSLKEYIISKFGAIYGQAFETFEKEVVESILEEIKNDDEDTLLSNLNVPEGMYHATLPINHSFTYTFMNDKELGYKLGNEPVIIEQEVAPSLFNIVKSLEQHKKEMQMNTIYDFLITADGVKYKLYRHYALFNQYMIAKA